MLLGNYSVLNRSPMRFLAGGTATPEVGSRANWQQNGNGKNRQYVSMTTAANRRFSLPCGSYPPYATMMPQRGGDMSARRSADFAIAPAATGVLGMPAAGTANAAVGIAPASVLPADDASPLRTGSASFAVVPNALEGQLMSSGEGSAALTISTNGPQLTASISSGGALSFAVSTNAPTLGALANAAGSSEVAFSAAPASILPLDDASPLRTGAAGLAFTGALVPYAVGRMAGSTTDDSVLTSTAIAAAVWDSVAAQFTDSATFGGKLNTASSGGVDLNALAQAVRAELATELARLDVRVGTRASQADVFAA